MLELGRKSTDGYRDFVLGNRARAKAGFAAPQIIVSAKSLVGFKESSLSNGTRMGCQKIRLAIFRAGFESI